MNRKRALVAILAVVLIAVALWALFFRADSSDSELQASGTVEATAADLGFSTGGRVESIEVTEGSAVAAGQELARVDRAELDARREQATAQLSAARAQLAELERGARPGEVEQTRAAVATAEQRLADAARDLERARALEAGGAVSREALDKARTAHALATAQLQQARATHEMMQAGPRAERVAGGRAQVELAQAAVQQIDAVLTHATIRAPFAGVVTVRHRQIGETVSPGAPVLTVMNPADRWVRIYIPEDRIGRIALGQKAVITSDSYENRSYDGVVTFIASEAEFTPRNVQTPEERVKLVYAVKVAITGDSALELKPGMPADVELLAPAGAR